MTFFTNIPQIALATENVDFSTVFNSTNLAIIYKVGTPLQSYIPGRLINGITGFVSGQGYYVIAKQTIEVENLVVGYAGNAIGDGTDIVTDSDGNFISDL